MMFRFNQGRERGIALLIVLFALLLLSVIGLGMMYSTNLETSINANYRDKQAALYAALAGLQEARDRIQPATHNIVAPTLLPGFVVTASAGSAGVIYIISNSSVDPTNSSNTYFDTELCQESVLGMTGAAAVPCTAGPTVPGGQTWYQPFVNDSTGGAPWNLSPPFDTKWVRITLKGNNMTPTAVNGSSTTSTQVCWDGHHQILLPSGYGSNCSPNGSVATLTLTNAGSGYTSTPTVTIGAPPSGGTQATASIQLSSVTNGQVAQVNITTGGVGYTTAPTVTFTGGGGMNAAGTALISAAGSPVQSLTLVPATPGAGTQCYLAAPSVTISGGGGGGATATAALNTTASCIYSWNPTASCGSPWKGSTQTGITVSGGGGSNFGGTITFASSGHSITSSSIQNSGSSYTSAPTTAGGGSPNPLTGSCVVTPNAVPGYFLQSISLTNGGSGYVTPPTLTVGTGNGVGTLPTATATLGTISTGQVLSVTMTNNGSGYTSSPTVTFTGGGATIQATGTAILGVTNTLQNLTLVNAGSGYTSDPTVTIGPPGGGGVQATATATIGRGTDYGQVWLLTALAQTKTGARSMAQMEVASPVLGYASTGALTIAGPSPTIGAMPNSANFLVHGNDANSCGQTAQPAHPAIEGYDNPNSPTNPTSVQTITNSIPSGRTGNYTGAGSSPDVENGYSSLGETMGTPTGLKALTDAIQAVASANGTLYGSNPGSINLGTSSNTVVDYVAGDLSLSGSSTGYGVLVVTGTLTMSGNFSWSGLVFVVGDGIFSANGGGNGQITGSLIVAKIWDDHTAQNLLSSLGSPTINWNGGGGNGIQYDHCWTDNLMQAIPFTPPPTTMPLKVLSFRALP